MFANIGNYDLLEIVEGFAEFNDLRFVDEESVSAAFNEDVRPAIVAQYGEDDQDAIDQGFNDWTDGLCKDGELHDEQYNKYEYLGKHV